MQLIFIQHNLQWIKILFYMQIDIFAYNFRRNISLTHKNYAIKFGQ